MSRTVSQLAGIVYTLMVLSQWISTVHSKQDSRCDNPTGSGCSQLCADSAGAVSCFCERGYNLSKDGRGCTIPGWHIVYVSGASLLMYDPELDHSTTLIPHTGNITQIAFLSDMLYWSDSGGVFRLPMATGDQKQPETVVNIGVKSIRSLAIDPKSGNVYMVDDELREVIVCTSKGDNCSTIIKYLKKPQHVTVNTRDSTILWTSHGDEADKGTITQANIDGTETMTLFDHLQQPSYVIYDVTSSSLFWMEEHASRGHVIKSVLLLTRTNIREVARLSGFSLPSMSILADTLYVAEGSHVLMINKFTSLTGDMTSLSDGVKSTSVTFDGANITQLLAYQPSAFDFHDESACASSPCSHICVEAPTRVVNKAEMTSRYRCLCPAGMRLPSPDASVCYDTRDEVLVVSCIRGIYTVPLQYIGNASARPRRLYVGDVDAITYDGYRRHLIYHDATEHALKQLQIDSESEASTLYSDVSMVEGIAVDTSSGNIYWTTRQGKVYVGSDDGKSRVLIMSGLSKPRGITLHVSSRLMYICDWGSEPRILQCYMDGSWCTTFLSVPGGHPNMVAILTDSQHLRVEGKRREDINKNDVNNRKDATPKAIHMDTRQGIIPNNVRGRSDVIPSDVTGRTIDHFIVWTDSRLDMIGVQSVTSEYSRGNLQLHMNGPSPHPFALAVTSSRLFYTDLNSGYVHYTSLSDLRVNSTIRLDLGPLYGLAIITRSLTGMKPPFSPCRHGGGCSHVCLVRPNSAHVCMCPHGLILATDNRHCYDPNGVTDWSANVSASTISYLPNVTVSVSPIAQVNTGEPQKPTSTNLTLVITTVLVSLVAVPVIVILVVCVYRYNRRKRDWWLRFVRYKKASHVGDDERLVRGPSTCVQCDVTSVMTDDAVSLRDTWHMDSSRETSMVSMDSAFTEMKEFEMYCSIDNLRE